MNESSKPKQKSSHKRVSHKGSLFSHTKRRGGLDRLKERVSRRAKSTFEKGKKVYEKAKGLYDSVDDADKAMITRIAKKGYDTYKKRRALSERIEKNRQRK
jgi:hypothetical protein